MTYEEFTAMAEKPVGKTTKAFSSFPLWFGSHDDIIEEAGQFTVIDDFMSDLGMDSFEGEFEEHFPAYQALAACDVGAAQEHDPDFTFDSYSEFFLVVDTESEERRVLLWTGESQFEELFPSFEAFWESLVDWPTSAS